MIRIFKNCKNMTIRFVALSLSLYSIISFSTGCSDLQSAQASNVGFLTSNYDLKEKEEIPKISYNTFNTYGKTLSSAKNTDLVSASDNNQISGGTSNFITENPGTGNENEIEMENGNKSAKRAVIKAIKNNKEYASTTEKRREIVNYALQWVGNKYVYGGTSLKNGTDCSGFTMRVFEHFNIKLDRSSSDQRSNGKKVSKPKVGDLICYYGHVAIYIGDGKIVHASNSKPYPSGGIKISDSYDYRSIASIRDVIQD